MIPTPDLIQALVTQATPVHRLWRPMPRAALWLILAAGIIAVLALYHGLRPNLADKLCEPTFLIQLAASLLTGVTAAITAFHISLPDRSRAWLLLPLPTLLLWISSIGYSCLTNWVASVAGDPMLDESLRCFETVVLTSVPLSLMLLIMLRHAGPIRPVATAGVGALAVAALAATALSLLHDIDATTMVLIWNFGTVGLFVTIGSALSRRLFSLVGSDPLRT